MPVERRTHAYKECPQKGCSWKLVTSEFVGGPHNIVEVDAKTQELRVTAHMVSAHGMKTPPRVFT